MGIHVEYLLPGADLSAAFAIREQIFQGEDHVPNTSNFDGKDDTAEQFMAYDDENPIGTARYRLIEPGLAKVERVAVLPEYRGHGVGKAIMAALETTATQKQVERLMLYAKLAVSGFYVPLGYHSVGEPFMNVGLPHLRMEKTLPGIDATPQRG